MLMAGLMAHPYEGRIFPVSRSHEEVMGLKAWPSLDALPETPDLAVLAIPAPHVAAELRRCAERGIRAVLIVTSGFAEQTGEQGAAMQDEIRGIARAHDLAVLGPNSEGFANTALSLAPTFSPAMAAPDGPLLPPWHKLGRVAAIAQSGAVGFSLFDRGRQKELPFRYVVTTGNEAALGIFDLVDYMLDEGGTDVFLLFLEDVKNASTFRRVAEKALRAGKPIIAAKLGRSDAAVRATASHTGALAGEYRAYEAMFAHYGILTGQDAEQMADLANAFLTCGGRLPRGRRVGICTGSGGAGAWMADACHAEGLLVPELDPQTRAEIDRHLPPYGTSQNPVDGTAQAIHAIGYAELARLVSRSPEVDCVIMVTTARRENAYEREKDAVFSLAREGDKPVLCWTYTLPHATSSRLFAEAGLALHTNLRNCARSMAALAEYRETRDRFAADGAGEDLALMRPPQVDAALADPDRVLCEYEAKKVLASCGIGSAAGALARDAEEAVRIAAGLDGPVALKLQSPDIAHKSEAGGVLLNVEGKDAVGAAYAAVLRSARAHDPRARIDGVLVEPMAEPGVEVILGVHRDETFGPLLMAGIGGIHVEIFDEVVFAPVPLSRSGARAALQRLKAARLLEGVRGASPCDTDVLIETMTALSRFAFAYRDAISDIDLNPVIVHTAGRGVTIADALIVTRDPQTATEETPDEQ